MAAEMSPATMAWHTARAHCGSSQLPHFVLDSVWRGADTMVIADRNHNDGPGSEVVKFGDDGRAHRRARDLPRGRSYAAALTDGDVIMKLTAIVTPSTAACAAITCAAMTTMPAIAGADPAAELPTTEQVSWVLTALADPAIPDKAKNSLVQGGIGSAERRAFTHSRLKIAAAHGELPMTFDVGNIWRVGADTAAAQVTLSGPKLVPTTKVLTFVDQGRWMLSSDSAAALISTVDPD